jgi:hypothetical protein
MAAVALVGTLDTKGRDYAFLAERLANWPPQAGSTACWPRAARAARRSPPG